MAVQREEIRVSVSFVEVEGGKEMKNEPRRRGIESTEAGRGNEVSFRLRGRGSYVRTDLLQPKP